MKRNLIIIALISAFLSCTKTITPKLNNAQAQINIQGAVSDTAGPYFVSIVKTVGFYENNTFPGVSGATVTITDSTAGVTDELTETADAGLYRTWKIMQGIPGHTYLLNVSLNGARFTASSTMPQPVQLDSVTFDLRDTSKINSIANYQDPGNTVNYYKYNLLLNGVKDDRFLTFDDRLSNGRYIRDKVDADTGEIKNNYVVQLSLVGVDAGVYTYLHEAEAVAYDNGSLSSPATPTTNIHGGCLGYFSAQTVSNKTAVVKY
ncbi:hypothetical protein A4D02_24535 [Niastella koreensis]|uniref:DUF4249 domain-containing protein n=2 Tax=Niastella koreensis TaxID=354356 RepID=G8TER5_NIAKG|nr:DUF4249 family protein [Niastella koreensis]AEW00501.1 hypothetical protein Niako_4229 [Niastella koreensis GR20-10]OQP52362.1 hypothetical protein A4D02_24535 [Niastella koreensis]